VAGAAAVELAVAPARARRRVATPERRRSWVAELLEEGADAAAVAAALQR
jgi:hypothetical protein